MTEEQGKALGFLSLAELKRLGFDDSPEAEERRKQERARRERLELERYWHSKVQYEIDEQLRNEHRDDRWEMFQPDDGSGCKDDRARKLCLIRDWASDPVGSLVLFGGVGRGKTLLAVSTARQILDDRIAADRNSDISFRYETERAVMDSFMNARKFQSREKPEEVVRGYTAPAVLIVDEMGKWSAQRDGLSVLEEIADERRVTGKPTIWVTNLSWSDFKERYSDGLISRISGHMYVIQGADHRQLQKPTAKPKEDLGW